MSNDPEDALDRLLRQTAPPPLDDQGFTLRVLAALPAQTPTKEAPTGGPVRRGDGWLLAAGALGAAVALAGLQPAGLQALAQAASDAAQGRAVAPADALAWLGCLGTALVLGWSLSTTAP